MQTQLKILRVFGVPSAEVSAVLRQARADGCPGLRLLERDGEFAVCVQVSAPNRAMAEQYCDKWVQKLTAKFGDAVYGTGEVSLAQATLDALLQRRKLLVAVDETTGRLLGDLLQPLKHSEAVFDFGTESYADAQKSRRINAPNPVLQKFPGDIVQSAAVRAQAALDVTGADFAAAYMPATIGQGPFVLVCDKRGAIACAVAPDLSDAAIANQMLDLIRRRALGLHLSAGVISFRPGHEHPLLLVSERGRARSNTTRFSLRRRTPLPSAQPSADFEAMMDFDAAAPIPSPGPADSTPEARAAAFAAAVRNSWREDEPAEQTAAPAAGSEPSPAPTGAILFEDEQPEPEPPAAPERRTVKVRRSATPQEDALRAEATQRTLHTPPAEVQPFADLAQDEPPLQAVEAAQALFGESELGEPEPPRRGRTIRVRRAPQEKTAETVQQQEQTVPAPSLLDGDIPDLSAELDPKAIAEAMAADEAAEAAGKSPSAEEFRAAANRLFGEEDEPAEEPAARPKREKRGAPVPKTAALERVEREERRRRRSLVTGMVILLLAAAAAAFGIWQWLRNDLGPRPAPKSYGTTLYDDSVADYLSKAQQMQEGVVGYLGFPGMDGAFVYTESTGPDAETGADLVRFKGGNYLDFAAASSTVLECTGDAYAGMQNLDTMQKNSGFSLYLPDKTYRFKVVAVYYYDPAETGAQALDLYGSGDLSQYYNYLRFVAGTQARSLYNTGVEVGDHARFLTLTTHCEEDVLLCITGRMIEEGEAEQLSPMTIAAAEQPLLTAQQYQRRSQPMPTVTEMLSASVDRYAQQGVARTAKDNAASGNGDLGGQDLEQSLAELGASTDKVLAGATELLAGLTDVAGKEGAAETDLNKGAEGSLPEQTVTVDQLVATATPTPEPTPTPDSSDVPAGSDAAPVQTPAPAPSEAPSGGSSAAGETINVTMNGSAQTMDLVQCLAMVAQNELGSNAPMEAYKAQCVATHCWILSQGGYPSVLGATPGANALAAAQEVAHVLITYNGQVCFTPYFAAASTGTASSKDVWGGDRAWLQAVDSPYDQQYATHWNTNGQSSGTARFSREKLVQRIKEKMDFDFTDVDPNQWFTILSKNQYGWVAQMQIGPDRNGQSDTCSGRWFRENLLAGQSVDGRSLRSQCFTFTYDAATDCFIFDVYGYGHGCGMSQWGAIGYAKNGWGYQDILRHYYPNTTLTTY